jgi:hypothetical protein
MDWDLYDLTPEKIDFFNRFASANAEAQRKLLIAKQEAEKAYEAYSTLKDFLDRFYRKDCAGKK